MRLFFFIGLFIAGIADLRAAEEPLRLSVYATAGDVLKHASTEQGRRQVLQALEPLRVTRLFLEGRRGEEYVPPDLLKRTRDFFEQHGIACSGGIATVPGIGFGVRQNGPLGWLNWQDPKTQRDVTHFFEEDALLFQELIVDDFFCTADTSPLSNAARGERPWGEYRRDLLVSLIEPTMRRPMKQANPGARLIIKFPQWYDRFHLFGYDPARMAPFFDDVWVGTEIRNPKTRRMGYVQPTEGFVNFRWLSSVAGPKVKGAWFDHIECSPQNFVDQAFQSVLAGARELTLFRLGDVMEKHPGDAALARSLPELFNLAGKVQRQRRVGISVYKPANSDGDENLYLMDYLAMMGLPILPEAAFPTNAPVVFLGVQAAADSNLIGKMSEQLERGATLVLTPALVRKLGAPAAELAGIDPGPKSIPVTSAGWASGGKAMPLLSALEIDAGLTNKSAQIVLTADTPSRPVPLLTFNKREKGSVFVLNIRTFSEEDFHAANEFLLAPKPLGWGELAQPLADKLRQTLLASLGPRIEASAGLGLYLFERACCLYNFQEEPAIARIDGKQINLGANQCLWADQ